MNAFVTDPSGLRAMTTDIVAAYVSKNHLSPTDVPSLVATVHGALADLTLAQPVTEEKPQLTPAEIQKSITPDALISFLDGKPYKSPKRHLTKHGLTPEGYRARFGLPIDYPTVSANYSAHRYDLGKALGLGHGGARSASMKLVLSSELSVQGE